MTWEALALDRRQKVILLWAGLAVIVTSFEGSVLILALPAIAREFRANTLALSDLGSVLAIGTLGALPLALLADRFGRRRMIAVGVAGSSLANFISGFAVSLAQLAFLKLFAVTFEVLVIGVVTALIVEEAPAERRGTAVSLLALLSGVGIFIVVVVYPLVAPHWRWLYYAGGAGILLSPFIWWLLPESRTWQHVRVTGSALRVLLEPKWRRRIIVLATMTGLLSILLEPAGLLYTVFATFDLHWSAVAISVLIVVSGFAGALCYVAGGFLTDRFGRRGPAIALTIATAASTSLSFASGSVGFFAGNVLWSAFASAATPVFGAWSGELFPTRARATAEAVIAVVAGVGGIAGLQAVGSLAPAAGLGGAIELSGVAAIAGALLLFLLPETKEQPLPE
ncbi:MAG TPA: MFS transporter [Candidatus Limnocylindrales bacterium]|nr:MFS transporter [Candidatus Limnocylindrales bacterium]